MQRCLTPRQLEVVELARRLADEFAERATEHDHLELPGREAALHRPTLQGWFSGAWTSGNSRRRGLWLAFGFSYAAAPTLAPWSTRTLGPDADRDVHLQVRRICSPRTAVRA